MIILSLNSSQFQNTKYSRWGISYFCSDFKLKSQNNRVITAAILSMRLALQRCLCNASVPDSHLYMTGCSALWHRDASVSSWASLHHPRLENSHAMTQGPFMMGRRPSAPGTCLTRSSWSRHVWKVPKTHRREQVHEHGLRFSVVGLLVKPQHSS